MSTQFSDSYRSLSGPRSRIRTGRLGRRDILYRHAQGEPVTLSERRSSREEHIVTPGGPRPRSLVHTLEKGHRLRRTATGFQQVDAAGHVLKDLPEATFRSDIVASPADGWVVYAYWANGLTATVQSFRCSWTVPPPPQTISGQTVFLFIAIEDDGRDNILQPVLQWGSSQAGGGDFWSICSWYVDPSGTAIHTTPVPVEPGEVLTGVITVQAAGGGQYTYTCEFAGKEGTALVVPEVPELVWYSTTLEAYDINNRGQYPNADKTVFSALSLQIAPPAPVVAWNPTTRSNDLGESVTIISDGAANAQIEIGYGSGVSAPQAAPLAVAANSAKNRRASRRPLLQKLLGSGTVFLLLLAALAGSAATIEWSGTLKIADLTRWWTIVLGEIVVLAVVAGFIAKGRALGVLIDDRNRMSLARFQLLSWSLLILSAYFAFAMWNIRRHLALPQMQLDLWYLLGITNVTSVASALVLNPKRELTAGLAQGRVPAPDAVAGSQSVLDVRASAAEASWTDLFFGEEASNKDTVDVSRLQQFTFTVILLFAFVANVLNQIAQYTSGRLDMPGLDLSAVGLMGLSNLAYLAAKQTAKPPVTPL